MVFTGGMCFSVFYWPSKNPIHSSVVKQRRIKKQQTDYKTMYDLFLTSH